MAFIGMSGVPPVTGPMTVGTATAGLNGSADAAAVVDVEAGAAAGLVDEEHPAATATVAHTIAVAARVGTVGSFREGRAGP